MAARDYYTVLQEIHSFLCAPTYLEIGVRHGQSWKMVDPSSVSIGIDPTPTLKYDIPGQARLFEGTSDEFFRQYDVASLTKSEPIWLSFIDGMHLFEFALRDFIKCEGVAHPEGAILIHDCLPIDEITSARERTTSVWSGDVYKLVLCLKKYRPDLTVVTLDTPPTGLGIVRGLNPQSEVLTKQYAKIVAEYTGMRYATLGTPQQKNFILNVVPDSPMSIGKYFGNRSFASLKKGQSYVLNQGSMGKTRPRPAIQKLGVLLCYNDADILEASLNSLLESGHKLVVWNHGSTDETSKILANYSDVLLEHRDVPRSFDFYQLYEAMSENLKKNYCDRYDWISWPDQDEILEGPDRSVTYADAIAECVRSGVDSVGFDNFNFWFTERDDSSEADPIKRVRSYGLFADCAPRIRSWRAGHTNIRRFNHNPIPGRRAETNFVLRHYPMRTLEQARQRIGRDRAGLARDGHNYHYENMREQMERLIIPSTQLHLDDGISPLRREISFDWRKIYGHSNVAPTRATNLGPSQAGTLEPSLSR